MSHQTGITANDELLRFFSKCRDGNIRTISIVIENEELTLGEYRMVKGSWKDDYDRMVVPLLKEKIPLYILYRLDKRLHGGYEWILISWSPDDSPVRLKMLYASTKATLRQEFGASHIVDELFGSSKEDVSYEGLRRHQLSEAAPAPLTSREEEMKEIQRLEVGVDVGIDTRHQTLAGIAFPLTQKAADALYTFSQGKIQYVQLKIDIEMEKIELSGKAEKLDVRQLPGQVPQEFARFHLYRFDHDYEGDFYYSVLFIYSMPGYSCPIKERMLYSSSRNPITDFIENVVKVSIAKKLEIGEGSELTPDFLLDEIHPKRNLHRPKFAKPKGPANRGAKRLTRAPQEDD